MVAARLAEDPSVSVAVLEAGTTNYKDFLICAYPRHYSPATSSRASMQLFRVSKADSQETRHMIGSSKRNLRSTQVVNRVSGRGVEFSEGARPSIISFARFLLTVSLCVNGGRNIGMEQTVKARHQRMGETRKSWMELGDTSPVL